MKLVVLASLVACGDNHPGVFDGPDMADSTPDAFVQQCKVQEDSPDVGACTTRAPADSFDPVIQWTWTGPTGFERSAVTPLVANLTDDNGDAAIDLCDIPDVVIVASARAGAQHDKGHLFVLDGQTGALHFEIPTDVDSTVTPALGDLDGDGIPEIVTLDLTGKVMIFDHTGALIAGPAGQYAGNHESAGLALADLDHDGDVEILGGNTVFDHHGEVLWTAPTEIALSAATTAADLDGDGFLDVVIGSSAYKHDGTLLWDTKLEGGFPHVANFDADAQPEVLLTSRAGVSLIQHDGTVTYAEARFGPGIFGINAWLRPAAVGDFDGDGVAEFAMCSQTFFSVFDPDGTPLWSQPVSDNTGIAGSTAFDFLGDGTPELVFADEQHLYVFGPLGQQLVFMPRTSGTLMEYPVVADIDNDGSAEIVIVSNRFPGLPSTPTVQVFRDRDDRWIQARRIWNQHTYHVTNVREDGTIPQFEVPSWQQLNTFRTNAQINGNAICNPPR